MSTVAIDVEGIPAPGWIDALEHFALVVLERLGHGNWELSILLCGDPLIRELNGRYRSLDEPTDVLSFGQDDGPSFPGEPGKAIVAGDIVISLDALERNAANFGVTGDDELKRLVLHGILHLGGMDHTGHIGDGGPGEEMLVLQERLLAELSEEHIF